MPESWEGDFVKAAFNRSAAGSRVEWTTRSVILCRMDGCKEAMADVIHSSDKEHRAGAALSGGYSKDEVLGPDHDKSPRNQAAVQHRKSPYGAVLMVATLDCTSYDPRTERRLTTS